MDNLKGTELDGNLKDFPPTANLSVMDGYGCDSDEAVLGDHGRRVSGHKVFQDENE